METESIQLSDLPPDLAKIMSYWTDLCADRPAPAWRDIDLVQFPSRLLPMTMVIDIMQPLEKSVFRFWGSELTWIHGVEMTGKHPYDLKPVAFGQQLRIDHQDIVDHRRPNANHYSFMTRHGYMHAHTALRVPIMNDSETVSQIIVVIDFSPEALARIRNTGSTYAEIYETQEPVAKLHHYTDVSSLTF